MMRYFRHANRLPTTRACCRQKPTPPQACLGKKKSISSFSLSFSPKYISPKDPLPIFRPTRYLFPMRSSMPLEVILLLYFLMRFCDKRELVKRVWKVMERERDKTDQKRKNLIVVVWIKRHIFDTKWGDSRTWLAAS